MGKIEGLQFMLLFFPVIIVLASLLRKREKKVQGKRGYKDDPAFYERIYNNIHEGEITIEFIDFIDESTTMIGLSTSELTIHYTRIMYIDGVHESARISGDICRSEFVLACYSTEIYETAEGGIFIKNLITCGEHILGSNILEKICSAGRKALLQ